MTDLELEAVPETSGLLAEPPRRPPTAIGSGTLPPPPDPYRRRHSRTRRIALGLLAVIFALAALPLASSESAGRTAAASGFAAASVDVGLHAMTGSMHPWREVVGPAAWRMVQQATAWPARFGKRHGGEPIRGAPRFDLAIAGDEKSLYRRGDATPNDDDAGD